MNRKIQKIIFTTVSLLLLAAVAWFAYTTMEPVSWKDWFLTPDQQGDHFMRSREYMNAAKVYRDPMKKGTAFYRAGEFKDAASVFSRLKSPEAFYNKGNSLLMHGAYDDAIIAYDEALKSRPEWKDALDNKALAKARGELVKKKGGDDIEGQEKPDDIVFDKNKNKENVPDNMKESSPELSDKELQAMWLRRIQTTPEDFLRAKFSFQYFRDKQD